MIFWIEVTATFVILCIGIFLTIRLGSGSNSGFLESVLDLVWFSVYLIKTAIEFVPKIPIIPILFVLLFSLSIGSLFYFAQTDKDKHILKYESIFLIKKWRVVSGARARKSECVIGVIGQWNPLVFGLNSAGNKGHLDSRSPWGASECVRERMRKREKEKEREREREREGKREWQCH